MDNTGAEQSLEGRLYEKGWVEGSIFLRNRYSDDFNPSFGIYTGEFKKEDNKVLLLFTDDRWVEESQCELQTTNSPNIMWFFDKEVKRLDKEHKRKMEVYMLKYLEIYGTE